MGIPGTMEQGKVALFFTFAFSLFTLQSCGGKHANYGLDDDGNPIPTELQPNFNSIKALVLQQKCLSCHSPGGTAASVPLSSADEMIHSPREIVLPGNPDESGLVIAIERTDSRQMPPLNSGIERLDNEEIGVIRQWIQEGASQ